MIQVGLLTEQQKNELVGQQYTTDSYFNPIQDFQDNWVISIEEITLCDNPQFLWIKDLPLIEYQPKLINYTFVN
jgi:hypothetical protein